MFGSKRVCPQCGTHKDDDDAPEGARGLGRSQAAFYQRDYQGPEGKGDKGREGGGGAGGGGGRRRGGSNRGDRSPTPLGSRLGGKGGKGPGKKRKYDPVEADRNNPFAHLVMMQYGGILGAAAFAFTAHRAAWLADKGVGRVADVVDSVADAAVLVVDAAAIAGVEAVHFWTKVGMHATILSLVLVAWFWVLKIRLRLAGKEPEANIFSVDDVFAAARNPKGVKQCLDKVELKHLSPEGRVYYRVFNSTAVPYEVILGYRDFKAGASVDDVVRGCNCLDYAKRGGVCKHAGACCLHLLRNTAMVEQSCVTGPPLAAESVRAPLALEMPRAQRRAISLGDPRGNSRGETLCLSSLVEKARQLQARMVLRRSEAAGPRLEPSAATVGAAGLGRGISVQVQTVGKTGATFLAAVEAQRYTECLLADAAIIESVEFVAYSFDVQAITEALAHLGSKVKILMDHSMCFGRTRRQLQAAQQLASNGCTVRVGRGGSVREAYRARDREVTIGDSVKGIIHGKSVLVRYDPNLSQEGACCVIGSTNWTDSSTANLEFSAVLHSVGETFVESWSREFGRGWLSSVSLDAAIAEQDREGYMRRSASRSEPRA